MWLGEDTSSVSIPDSVPMTQVTECLSDNILQWISPTKLGIMGSLSKTESLTASDTNYNGWVWLDC